MIRMGTKLIVSDIDGVLCNVIDAFCKEAWNFWKAPLSPEDIRGQDVTPYLVRAYEQAHPVRGEDDLRSSYDHAGAIAEWVKQTWRNSAIYSTASARPYWAVLNEYRRWADKLCLVTSRPASLRGVTVNWLKRYQLRPAHDLHMLGSRGHKASVVWSKMRELGLEPGEVLFVDDTPEVVHNVRVSINTRAAAHASTMLSCALIYRPWSANGLSGRPETTLPISEPSFVEWLQCERSLSKEK